LGEHVRLLVADELALKAGTARELDRALVVTRGRRAGALALLAHQSGEPVLVDRQPALARELLRELERKAVRVVQPEGVLARDAVALARDFLEQAQPARQRLPEALLLGREDSVDLRRSEEHTSELQSQ